MTAIDNNNSNTNSNDNGSAGDAMAMSDQLGRVATNDFMPEAAGGHGPSASANEHEISLEPLPFGQHFNEREHVYHGNFVAMMLDAVALMPDHFGDLTRVRVAGQEPVTLAELADRFQISKSTVVVHLKRGARKSLDKNAVVACELLYLLVHWHRSRRREGCSLEFLESQYRWLQGITQHPNLVEYALQVVARKVEFGPASLGLLTLDNGSTYLTAATQKTYQSMQEQVVLMVRQCAFMHMTQQDIEHCVFAYLEKHGFRDLSVAMLNHAFSGMVLEYNSANPKVLAAGTGADAYTLAVLMQSDEPMSISQIHQTVLNQYGLDLAAHRISKSGKDSFLCFRAGVFGLENHFMMSSYVRQRIQSAALAVLRELGEGFDVDDEVLEWHVNTRLQTPLQTPEGLMPPVSRVNRYELAMAIRGTPGIDVVGARLYQLTPKGRPTLSPHLVREKVVAWIMHHRQPISLEKVREIAPEIMHFKKGYALCADDVLIRIGHGIYWLRELPLPDGVLFDLAANGFVPSGAVAHQETPDEESN